MNLAMDEAGVGWEGLSGVAATAGPGLIGGRHGRAVDRQGASRWRAACR